MRNKKFYELLPFLVSITVGVDLMLGIGPAAITFGFLGWLTVSLWGGEK